VKPCQNQGAVLFLARACFRCHALDHEGRKAQRLQRGPQGAGDAGGLEHDARPVPHFPEVCGQKLLVRPGAHEGNVRRGIQIGEGQRALSEVARSQPDLDAHEMLTNQCTEELVLVEVPRPTA
jgi:hypothetical protein